MLRIFLESVGCSVVEAASGEEGVEAARRACPDVVLLDLNMPVLDGLGAAERIRSVGGRCRDVPIIAITAFDIYGMREAALEAGCDEYLTKPLDFARLERTLGRAPEKSIAPAR